jgi:hypothetical protein
MNDDDDTITYNISPSVSAMIADEQSLQIPYFSIDMKVLHVATLQEIAGNLGDVSSMIRHCNGTPIWDFMYAMRQANPDGYAKVLGLIGPNPYWSQPTKPYPTLVKIARQFVAVGGKYNDLIQFEPACYIIQTDGSLRPSLVGVECFVQPAVVFEQPCSRRRISFAQAFEYKQEIAKVLTQLARIQDEWLMYCSLLDSILVL